MLQDVMRLTTKVDVLTPLITTLVLLMVGAVLVALIGSSTGDWVVIALCGGVILLAVANMILKLRYRYRELSKGHCPNPLCHGVVQHSELVPKGWVICPTCKARWPEIRNIKFKATARQL